MLFKAPVSGFYWTEKLKGTDISRAYSIMNLHRVFFSEALFGATTLHERRCYAECHYIQHNNALILR
jgi:hypothetical protein